MGDDREQKKRCSSDSIENSMGSVTRAKWAKIFKSRRKAQLLDLPATSVSSSPASNNNPTRSGDEPNAKANNTGIPKIEIAVDCSLNSIDAVEMPDISIKIHASRQSSLSTSSSSHNNKSGTCSGSTYCKNLLPRPEEDCTHGPQIDPDFSCSSRNDIQETYEEKALNQDSPSFKFSLDNDTVPTTGRHPTRGGDLITDVDESPDMKITADDCSNNKSDEARRSAVTGGINAAITPLSSSTVTLNEGGSVHNSSFGGLGASLSPRFYDQAHVNQGQEPTDPVSSFLETTTSQSLRQASPCVSPTENPQGDGYNLLAGEVSVNKPWHVYEGSSILGDATDNISHQQKNSSPCHAVSEAFIGMDGADHDSHDDRSTIGGSASCYEDGVDFCGENLSETTSSHNNLGRIEDDSSDEESENQCFNHHTNPLIAELYSSDSDYESASDDEDSQSHQGLLQRNATYEDLFKTVMTQNEISAGVLLQMILKFAFKNNLSFSGIVDLAKMMNAAVGSRLLPDTRYLFDKLCNPHTDYTLHAVCPDCDGYAGTFEEAQPFLECESCSFKFKATSPSDGCYFAILDPSEPVKDYLELYEDHYDYVMNDRQHDPHCMKDIQDGEMHINFVRNLPECDRHSYASASMNLDGVQLSKSSNLGMTPVYLMINELPPQVRLNNPILAGLWAGKRQPVMNVFLEKFVEKMNEITARGIECTIKGKKLLVKLHIVVSPVDTMARFKMNNTKLFMCAFGCDWCLIKGKRHAGSMRYRHLSPPAPARTVTNHVFFAEEALRTGADHCFGVTPQLSPLINCTSFNIIKGFVPEPMHQTSGGTAKQLTESILYTLKPAQIDLIEHYLEQIRVPAQLGRLTRSIKCRAKFKCREWENWLIFHSMPILPKVIKDQRLLHHWGKLVDTTHLSQKTEIYSEERAEIKTKLDEFAGGTEEIYSLAAMTYNMHQSEHMYESIENWGPGWAHSAYKFESANGTFAACVKSSKGVILQIIRQLNLRRFNHILERMSDPHSARIVQEYCDGMVGSKSVRILQVNSHTYLGKPRVVEQNRLKELNLKPSSRRYIKCVIKGCLFMSEEKINRRSCNYYAQLKCGTYVKILQFIVNAKDRQEITVCQRINVRPNRYASTVKEIESFVDGEHIVPTDQLDKICVYIKIDSDEYITPVPNMLHY